jgi:hypothetical protein
VTGDAVHAVTERVWQGVDEQADGALVAVDGHDAGPDR